MTLKLYRILQFILSPFIDLYLKYRRIIGKEHKDRFHERIGKASVARPQGNLIWFHAASIGESVSILPLLKEIEDKYPELNIIVTTGTVTSAKLLEKKLSKRVIHQFVPADMLYAVKRFLKYWQPDVAIWVESEIWPNLVCETHASGCPLILINARMSSASLQKWKRNKPLADEIFKCFTLCLAQSDNESAKFIQAGLHNVITAGNLKYEAPSLPSDPAESGKMISMIAGRPIWLAASTSKGEEEITAFVHQKLAQKIPNLLTIIAPRHPQRGNEIVKMLRSKGLNVAQRSDDENIFKETQIYVADTIGELGIFYRISGVVYMGGSLVQHGGQNPLEAARLNCAIVTGDIIYNFRDIYDEMLANEAVVMIKNRDELAAKIEQLMLSAKEQDRLANNAQQFIQSKSGIINKYMENLSPYLKPLVKHVG